MKINIDVDEELLGPMRKVMKSMNSTLATIKYVIDDPDIYTIEYEISLTIRPRTEDVEE